MEIEGNIFCRLKLHREKLAVIFVDLTVMRIARLFLPFFFFALTFQAVGQNLALLDSLHKKLSTASGQQRFAILTAIGFEYRYSYPDSTLIYCSQAYELGTSLDLPTELSKPLSFVGLAYANKGDYKKSLQFHEQAIQVAQAQVDSVQLAYGYNNLGRMFFDGGDMVRAYDNFIHAKNIFERLKDKSGLAYVFRSLANVYKFQKDFPNAIEMSAKALQLRKELGDKRVIISSLLELGLIYQAQGNTDLALVKFDEANKLAQQIRDKVTVAELQMGEAEIFFEIKDYKKAKEYAELVLQTISKSTNQKLFLRASLVLGKYFFVTKELDNSIKWFKQLYNESEESGNISFLRDASFYLSDIYKLKNQNDLAYDYNNKFRIYDEKLQNTDLTRQIERLQFLLQIENKEKENELLKANQARNNSIIAKQRFQNILLILVVVSIAVLAGVTFYNSRKRRLVNQKLAIQNRQIVQQRAEIEHQNEILSKRNQQLSDLNHEKDTLMNIVAHDLKSPLNRILGLARIMEMTGGLPQAQNEYLRLIKNATKSGSDLITDLLDVNAFAESGNSLKIANVNLEALINEKINAVATAAEAKKIELELSYHFPNEFKTDGDYVGRIIDNLITNAIKFSPVNSKIQINGTYDKQAIRLSIRDHGPGFSPEDKKSLFQKFKKLSARPTGGESSNGLGLAIVKTLVDRLDGQIELVSEQGRGSEFIVTIPETKN